MSETRINVGLIEDIASRRKQNLFRYYIAIYLTNNGQNRVNIAEFTKYCSDNFDVKPKTVSNNIYKMQKAGWGKIAGKYFYYISQEKLMLLLNVERLTYRAAHIKITDIDDLMKARSFFFNCNLSGRRQADGTLTIARDTLHDQICGHSRSTQLKYERMCGITKVFNYVAIEPASKDKQDMLYTEGQHTFIAKVGNRDYWVKQMSNTYYPTVFISKRKRRNYASHTQGDAANYPRFYHRTTDKFQSGDGVICQESNVKNKWGKLWFRMEV